MLDFVDLTLLCIGQAHAFRGVPDRWWPQSYSTQSRLTQLCLFFQIHDGLYLVFGIRNLILSPFISAQREPLWQPNSYTALPAAMS